MSGRKSRLAGMVTRVPNRVGGGGDCSSRGLLLDKAGPAAAQARSYPPSPSPPGLTVHRPDPIMQLLM